MESLSSGRLITWTKEYSCPGVVGENVVKLLEEAIKRQPVSTNRQMDGQADGRTDGKNLLTDGWRMSGKYG